MRVSFDPFAVRGVKGLHPDHMSVLGLPLGATCPMTECVPFADNHCDIRPGINDDETQPERMFWFDKDQKAFTKQNTKDKDLKFVQIPNQQFMNIKDYSCKESEDECIIDTNGKELPTQAIYHDLSEDDKVGVLCPLGKLFLTDSFHSPTFLKSTSTPGKKAQDYIADPKNRLGYLTMLQGPLKKVKIKYRICWLSKENFYKLFGFDYDQEGVKAKEENILEVEYSYANGTQLRSRRSKCTQFGGSLCILHANSYGYI